MRKLKLNFKIENFRIIKKNLLLNFYEINIKNIDYKYFLPGKYKLSSFLPEKNYEIIKNPEKNWES
jgi:hypothetical protein